MPDVWPVGLPQYVLVQGYSEEFADNLLETTPDIGPPISRPRSSSAARPLTVSFELSRDQLAILRTFYEVGLLRGSLPFSFSAPSEAATTYLVKFQKGGQPKVTGMAGRYFIVSMSFWILP